MRQKSLWIVAVAIVSILIVYRHSVKARFHAAVDLILSGSWGELHGPRPLVEDSLIAHGCGGVGGHAYTNSLTAIDSNYAKGHRVFELDLERTSDGKVALIHDWGEGWTRLHPASAPGRRSMAEFLNTPMIDGLEPMDWPLLADWLAKHQDAFIVTDAKGDNLAILKILAQRKDLVSRIIPQIYNFRQYASVQEMGYPRILLTLYRLSVGNWAVLQFVKTHPISGVVCWPGRGREGGLAKKLHEMDVPAIAHTINSTKDVAELKADGFNGVMTDLLLP